MTKICTSIGQSKKLLELGLDPSTADMCYATETRTLIPEQPYDVEGCEPCVPFVPAWSLTVLLGMIPLYTLEQTTDGKVIAVSEIGQYSKCSEACDNPIDAAFEIVCWLIEQKHIKVNK